MFEESIASTFESLSTYPKEVSEVSVEASLEAVALSTEVRSKSAKEIGDEFKVTDKTVQSWFKAVCAAYLWIDTKDLKTGTGNKVRYTPLCQALIAEYRAVASDMSEGDWIASIHAANPEKIPATPATQKQDDVPLSPTEVMPPNIQQSERGDRPGGMVLHSGSSLALPAIPGIVAGDDTAYLSQIQQRMSEFEALQQEAIAQMQEQFQQTQALNTQYQEAISLSDELLLKEFQLKGVQLGYTALQLKQQAFKATVQAAEAGSLPVPGKPQGENGQSQSA